MVDDRSHLNHIQDLCTGDAELVLGEIYGLREWFVYVSSDYSPVGPPAHISLVGHFSQPWDPMEVYKATCRAVNLSEVCDLVLDQPADAEDVEYLIRKHIFDWVSLPRDTDAALNVETARAYVAFPSEGQSSIWRHWHPVHWVLDDPFSDMQKIQIPKVFLDKLEERGTGTVGFKAVGKPTAHQVGHPRCVCGVYAYHNKDSLQITKTLPYEYYGTVYGLIKAYGHVTVGTKGFRAERAEIVALTLPQTSRLHDGIVGLASSLWRSQGITVLPDLTTLLEFSERGGYLTNPEDLQPETR